MQSGSEVKTKTMSNDDALRETVRSLIESKLQKIALLIKAKKASRDDYSSHEFLVQMLNALPQKNNDDLLADMIFLQQQEPAVFVGNDEKKSTESPVGPSPMSENVAPLSAIPEESTVYSPEERQRHAFLNQAFKNIPKLAALRYTTLEEFAAFIREQKKHARKLSLNDLEKYGSDLESKIVVETTKKKEIEEKEMAGLKQQFLSIAELLIHKLTSLQLKSTQEKETFRDQQMMLLQCISEDMEDIKNYIQGLRTQIRELQPDIAGQEASEMESKEIDCEDQSSPEASLTGKRQSSSSFSSTENNSPRYPSPERSPNNSGSSSNELLRQSRERFPFVASFSAPAASEHSASSSLTIEIPFSPTVRSPGRGSTPNGSAPS